MKTKTNQELSLLQYTHRASITVHRMEQLNMSFEQLHTKWKEETEDGSPIAWTGKSMEPVRTFGLSSKVWLILYKLTFKFSLLKMSFRL